MAYWAHHLTLLIFAVQLTSGLEIIPSSSPLDGTKTGKISLSYAPPKVKTVTFMISKRNKENYMNGKNGVYASQFLKLIRKIRQPQANLTSETSHIRKKAQGMEEGVVVTGVGDIVRVHIHRSVAPIFFSILAGLNIDARKWFGNDTTLTEIPTTTPWTPTTTKEYIYIILEDPTTTEKIPPETTTKKGKYRVIKNTSKPTTKMPSKNDAYVDDEDDSEILKVINSKGLKKVEMEKL